MSDDAAQSIREAGQRKSAGSRLLGMKFIDADAEKGVAHLEFDADEKLLNAMGTIQGGFIGAMLDDAMMVAMVTAVGPGFGVPTLEMKTNYMRAGQPGKLFAEGRIVHRGRSTIFAAADLKNAEGKLVATATSTARIVPLERRG